MQKEKEKPLTLPPIEHWHKLLVGKKLIEDYYSPRLFEPETGPLHTQASSFLSIPIEVRLQILQDVLALPDTTHRSKKHIKSQLDKHDRLKSLTSRFAIIFTCRQLFFELAPLTCKLNTFKRRDLPFDCRLSRRDPMAEQLELVRGSEQEIYFDDMLLNRK